MREQDGRIESEKKSIPLASEPQSWLESDQRALKPSHPMKLIIG
jgi:hypothetical protein